MTPANIIDSFTKKPPTKQQLRIKQKKLRKKLQQKLLPQEDEYIKNMTSLKLITKITKQRITTDKIRWLKTLDDKEHFRQVEKMNQAHHIDIPEEEQQIMDRVYDTQRQEKARQENTKNDKILYDSLLQVIHQTKDTTDKIGIIALCKSD